MSSVDDLRNLFGVLGYHSHPTRFGDAFTDPAVLDAINNKYPKEPLSCLLRALPDLFVFHPQMVKGMFFVRDVSQRDISKDEADSYSTFYPSDLLIARVSAQGSTRRLICGWYGDVPTKSLLDLLNKRFAYTPTSGIAERVRSSGWAL